MGQSGERQLDHRKKKKFHFSLLGCEQISFVFFKKL